MKKISQTNFDQAEAFVWIWLPGAYTPIVAGKLEKNGRHHDFFYGQSYLSNPNAIAISDTELPLVGNQRFTSQNEIHAAFADSLPDAWGTRVLEHYYQHILSPLDLLLLSSSDRIGALHFQDKAEKYIAREDDNVTLAQLLAVADYVEQGIAIPPELDFAVNHGTSIGGARPKATIDTANKKFIAKLSTSTDLFPIVQAEYAALWLAKQVGLQVAHVELTALKERKILLVERFDREKNKAATPADNWSRKLMVSALTLLNLNVFEARYASYLDLADIIRKKSSRPIEDLRELFSRILFNIIIGNTDDHAKNHAFFWDGFHIELTPAYDLCPYPRAGQIASQAMQIGPRGATSQLSNAIAAASWFELNPLDAKIIGDELVEKVKHYWPIACEKAELTSFQQKLLTHSAVLNPFIFM